MFEKYTAEQYRALDADAFEARRAEIEGLLTSETLPEGVTTDELVAESELIIAEARSRKAAQNLRAQTIEELKRGAGHVVASSQQTEEGSTMPNTIVDPFDTPEYRNAAMERICHGKEMPEEFRTGIYAQRTPAHTATTDVPVMIPTSTSNQIIEELEAENGIYSRITKTNVKGGVEYPILELKPTASWVGENAVSDWQKVEAKLKVTFSYYELECRISQTMLESIVTYEEFQRRFVPMAVKAILDKVEEGVISGTGEGQMLGIINDARVTNKVEMAAADVVDWKKWRKIVKAAIPRAYRRGQFIMSQTMWDSYIETMADDNNAPVSIGYNAVTGEETRRFMGFDVILVDDDLVANFDDAATGDVFCIYGQLSDYAINTNQQLMSVQYLDWDDRKKKTVAYMVLDGKVLDPHGFVLVAKK